MQLITVPATAVLILSLSTVEPVFARPMLNLMAPLETEIIRMAEAAGVNTSAINIHHIFQTIDLMKQANRVAMFSVHPSKRNRTIDTEHTLCSFISDHHHDLITNLKDFPSKYVNGTTGATTTTTITTTDTTTEVTEATETTDTTDTTDDFIYRSCMKFVVKGMTHAKNLAQQMAAAQQDSQAATPPPDSSTAADAVADASSDADADASSDADADASSDADADAPKDEAGCANGEVYDAESGNCVLSTMEPGVLAKRKKHIGIMKGPLIIILCGFFPNLCTDDDKTGVPWLDNP